MLCGEVPFYFSIRSNSHVLPVSIKIHKNLPGIGKEKLAMLWLGQEKSFSNGKRLVFPLENDKRKGTAFLPLS